ncbi:Disease resistance protein (CC-NBS-LRR class) family [Euphorbia peplus]|nr:Disease resistance protein (CC-NBS-LRR class) family [Euphorbia peplus]
MAAALVGSAATGAGLELVFGNFLRLLLEVRRANINFAPSLQILIDTMESIRPQIMKIEGFNRDFDQPDASKGLLDLLKKGEDLVIKCSKIHRLNYVKKPYYTKKLRKFDENLCRYINTILPIHNTADIKQTLFEVKGLSLQIRNLSMGTSSFGGSSKSSGILGVCSPPGLKVVPVGLEVPLKEMKEKLMCFDGVSEVIVVSAPGGCGKTTLAIAICQDDDVHGKFKESIFFVTVSKSPNLLVIVQRLFQHMDYNAPDFLSEEDAVNQLEILLTSVVSAPILLVLDDVWSGAEPLIEKLKFPIKDYKILVTSRFEFPRFGPCYKLQTLNPADSMALFCNQAFLPNGNSYEPSRDVLNKIVEVCKGFPLAISVVGKSLCGRSSVEWSKRVMDFSKASSLLANCELLNCLQSSIDALNDNATVKECYMDLGCFPEDHRIPASTLIDIWVERHNLREEDAVLNLYELSHRNLVDIGPARKDAIEDYGSIHVSQHDLLRELAIIQSNSGSIEQRQRLFIDITRNEIPAWWMEQRHVFINAKLLSICTDETFSSAWHSMEAPCVEVLVLNFQTMNYALPLFIGGMDKLKALVVANYGFSPAALSNFQVISSLSNLRRIRLERVSLPSFFLSTKLDKLEKISLVMCNIGQAFSNCCMPNLKEINIDYCNDLVELPYEFCDLISLIKLSITNCHKLSSLPEEIGNLVNLEVLRLNSCIALSELPNTIVRLPNLRILDISNCFDISELPDQMGVLNNLQKLYMIDCLSCKLPWSIMNLSNLREVIGDEETANSWKEFKDLLPNLEIKVHKDTNLIWRH